MKIVLGALTVVILIIGISGVATYWVFSHDEHNADKACAALGAEPHYTYRTRYICVTPDGRVVG